MKALPLVDSRLQSIQLLLVIAASQQRGTLSTLRPLDQLISDLQSEASLITLHVAQRCPIRWKLACNRLNSDLSSLLLICSPSSGWKFKKQINLKSGYSPGFHIVSQSSGTHHHHFGILADQKFVHLRGPHNVQITLHVGEP